MLDVRFKFAASASNTTVARIVHHANRSVVFDKEQILSAFRSGSVQVVPPPLLLVATVGLFLLFGWDFVAFTTNFKPTKLFNKSYCFNRVWCCNWALTLVPSAYVGEPSNFCGNSYFVFLFCNWQEYRHC